MKPDDFVAFSIMLIFVLVPFTAVMVEYLKEIRKHRLWLSEWGANYDIDVESI